MAFDLNPVAVSAAPLLRAIETGGWVTKTELAEMAGRQRSNIARDLTIIENAGLIVQVADANAARPIVLTEAGLAQLAAITRAEDPDASTGALTALLTDLEPHPLNPRKDFESDDAEDALNELRESILLRSLMQPIVVRPRPEAGKWWIVDGERRFRAIKQANWDGDWADDKPVPIVIRDVDDREHLLLSLTANLQRADMSAIEEGHAFHAAVHDFGLGTEDLANELGKSQRYVQQRIALLKLSPEDQDRMRLPRDHPDRISFKQARALTQTPRPADPADRPPPSQELSQALGTHGTANLGGGEPGSSPSPAADPDFDSTLSHKEALLLVEVADKADRDPAPEFAPEPYARVQAVPVKGEAQSLVEKNVLGFRQRGMHVFVRARVHTSGAYDWLVGLGFYGDHRADVLFEMRARVLGHDRASELAEKGDYATPWLNTDGPEPSQSDSTAGKSLVDVFTTWQNGTPYEPLFDRHNPLLTASRFAPDLPWAEWRDRPLSDFIDAERLETFCLGSLPTGPADYPDALIDVAPLKGGVGWVYGAGYQTSQYAHHERLRLVSDGKEAFADRETAIAAGVDLIRTSLGSVSKNRLPARTYDWTVAMLSPATRPAAKNAAIDAEPEQGELIVPTPEEAEAIAVAKRVNARRDTARAEVRYLTATALELIDQADFMTLPPTRRDCANLALDLLRANEPGKALIALAGTLVEYRDGAARPSGLRGAGCDSVLTLRHRIRAMEEL